jgi:hypothetical protein
MPGVDYVSPDDGIITDLTLEIKSDHPCNVNFPSTSSSLWSVPNAKSESFSLSIPVLIYQSIDIQYIDTSIDVL